MFLGEVALSAVRSVLPWNKSSLVQPQPSDFLDGWTLVQAPVTQTLDLIGCGPRVWVNIIPPVEAPLTVFFPRWSTYFYCAPHHVNHDHERAMGLAQSHEIIYARWT